MNPPKLLKRDVIKQFLRFCLIGLETTILYYLVFIVCFNFISINYLVSAAIAFISSVFLGFFFNKLYTFHSKRKTTITFPEYLAIYSISLLLHLSAMRFLVETMGVMPIISNLFVLPFTTMINFFGSKIVVFKNRRW